jgi:hypothetical protein
MSLFPVASEWLPPQNFPDLSDAKEIAIDLETCDPNLEKYGPGWPRKDGYIIGYAVAVDGWKGYYPVAHQGGGNLDKRLVENFIRKVLLLPADKIMHNAAYDIGWLRASGFEIKGRIIDTMLAAAVVDENRFSYALNSLGFDLLKEVKSEQGLREAAADFGVNPKKDMWKLPAMYVGAYAEQDAALTLKLWHYLRTLLRKEEVESIFELESELLPILIDVTYRGIRFDREKASLLIDQMQEKEKKLLIDIKKTAGVGVDIWAAASIAIENSPAHTSIAASDSSGSRWRTAAPMLDARNAAGSLAMARKGKIEVTPTTCNNPCASVTARTIRGLRRL